MPADRFNLPVSIASNATHSICITHRLYGLRLCYHFYGLNRLDTIMSLCWGSRV